MSIITIDTTQILLAAGKMRTLNKRIETALDRVMNKTALEMARTARRLAPADRSGIRKSISANTATYLHKEVNVNAPYAAYMEFGTGKKAAAWAAGLPDTWRAFAAQFKGPGKAGNFKDMVRNIAAWIKRKGIGATYSTGIVKNKGGKKSGYRLDITKAMTPRKKNLGTLERFELAYVIARSILKKGVTPHPFLFPAYQAQKGVLKQDLDAVFKNIKL